MLTFGTTTPRDVLISNNNFTTDGTTAQEFTIFEVSKINAVSDAAFGYFHLTDGSYIEMGTNAAGHYTGSVSDGTTLLTASSGGIATGEYHIGCLRKTNRSIFVDYKSVTTSSNLTDYDAAFDLTVSFENESFRIGGTTESDGLIPPASVAARYLDGDFQEAIIYDRKLSDSEMSTVDDYLNKKYRIY